jgi:outer membrane autotransporter protein
LDTKNRTGTLTAGLDRQLTEDVVAGFSLGLQSGKGSGFKDHLQSSTDGFTVGPYIAVRLSPNWAVDASFNYSQNKSNVQVVVLNGAADLRTYSGNIELHGQYTFGEWYVRPKLSVTYSRNVSDERDLQGIFLGLPLSLLLPASRSNYGVAEAYSEVSRLFDLSNGYYMIPYAEFGLHYEFERANGGQILTGELLTVVPAAWTGSVRSGVRMQFPNAALLEASIGYLSFGQPSLDVWEGRLRLSLGF